MPQNYPLGLDERFKSYVYKGLGPHLVHSLRTKISDHQMDEVDLVYDFFGMADNTGKLMIDVGAHYGTSLGRFAADGWQVHAFEPDDHNRSILRMRHGSRPNLKINACAVSDTAAEAVPFYRSDVSSGISGLAAFDKSHSKSQSVSLTTLDAYCDQQGIGDIDFLKIDTEGHDLLVLKGLDFGQRQPSVVVCEFEDKKTLPRGYSRHDLANFLLSKGYNLVISEWHPIKEYGQRHEWKAFRVAMAETDDRSWGNIVAFADELPQERVPITTSDLRRSSKPDGLY